MSIDLSLRELDRKKEIDPEDLDAIERYVSLLRRFKSPESIWTYNGARFLSRTTIQPKNHSRFSTASTSATRTWLGNLSRNMRSLTRLNLTRVLGLGDDPLHREFMRIEARSCSSSSVVRNMPYYHTHAVSILEKPRKIDIEFCESKDDDSFQNSIFSAKYLGKWNT